MPRCSKNLLQEFQRSVNERTRAIKWHSSCSGQAWAPFLGKSTMIRKLKSGQYRLYSKKVDLRTGKRRNLGTFHTLEKAKQHERAVQFFKRQH